MPEELGFRFGGEQDSSAESVHVQYYKGVDELRVSNTTLQDEVESTTDVGQDVARALFEEAFRRLASAGVVDAKQFDLAKVELSRTVTSFGSMIASTRVQEVVNTYDFLARRTLNGIPFVNQGVQIAIHRGGRVARVRVGGAHPVSLEVAGKRPGGLVQTRSVGSPTVGRSLQETPGGSGFVFAAAVDSGHYKERFAQENPQGVPDRSGVMYMLPLSMKPDSSGAGVLEPMFVFSFSSRFGEDASRRQYVGYSLRDPDAPFVDLSETPEPDATGDPRP